MFLFFFIQFYCVGSHTKHHWTCYEGITLHFKFKQCSNFHASFEIVWPLVIHIVFDHFFLVGFCEAHGLTSQVFDLVAF
jgi:hypothetical protein